MRGFAGKHAAAASRTRTLRIAASLQDLPAKERPTYSARVNQPLRALPSVDEVLSRPAVREAAAKAGHAAAKAGVRAAIAEARTRLQAGGPPDGEPVPDVRGLELIAGQSAPRLPRVLHATGVVLPTNPGRAPRPPEAAARAAARRA